jgi:glutamate formiminotransferase / 5-formyltetrahydrofolate cyclo-ligase
MEPTILLAVPNVSEGRDQATIGRIAGAFAGERSQVRLLDVHTDADHHRAVFTLAGQPGQLSDALLAGAAKVLETVDLSTRDEATTGQHPHVGALDVAPIVYLTPETRGAACAEALLAAERLAQELQLSVFLYGELTGRDATARGPRTRAELRRGGLQALSDRMAPKAGQAIEPRLVPDFGPDKPHPTAGVTLVAARPPLVAFNLQLKAPAKLEDARRIAAEIRAGAERGIPGLRAIGIQLREQDLAQVSMNVEQPFQTPLVEIVAAVSKHAPVASAEIVGLAPRAALDGFPEDLLPIPGFDPARHLIENAIGCK